MSTARSLPRALLVAGALLLLSIGLAVWLLRGAGRVDAPPARPGGGTLTATVRSEPRSFNRLVAIDRTSALVAQLTHARLVRVNLATHEVEPYLAERWTRDDDGLTWVLELAREARFSDGTPCTADDVVFSARAALDPRVKSPLAPALTIGGEPLVVESRGAHTVVVRFPSPYGPGLRLLDALPILPRHRLEAALEAGTLREAWSVTTPPAELAGLGPFVLEEYRAGEHLVFARNPHYFRKDERGQALPYLDRLVLTVVPSQDAEILRLEAGETDLVTDMVRAEDLARVRRLAAAGQLALHDLGVALDSDFLVFNLGPGAPRSGPRAWLTRRELRHAVSMAVDRQRFVDTVFLGAAVPVGGPVTPANRRWFDPSVPVPAYDPERAAALLSGVGLRDRDGDGWLEQPDGRPARFTLVTQKGNTVRERGAVVVQEALAAVGLGVDVVTLEQPAVIDRLMKGQYDAIHFGSLASDTDPASHLDYWLSRGAFHPWHPGQASPATEWEARIDALMARQVATVDPVARREIFFEVQGIFAEQLPAIYFAAPRVHVAMSARVGGARPAVLNPMVLWNAERLSVR
jgi:peptide/nickel transport system substrate-binding protein